LVRGQLRVIQLLGRERHRVTRAASLLQLFAYVLAQCLKQPTNKIVVRSRRIRLGLLVPIVFYHRRCLVVSLGV